MKMPVSKPHTSLPNIEIDAYGTALYAKEHMGGLE